MRKIFLTTVMVTTLAMCNSGQQKTSQTEVNATISPETTAVAPTSWTGEYGGVDKSYDTQLLRLRQKIAPTFKAFTFTDPQTGCTMEYSLFIPKGYTAGKQYPLVMFIADASTVGKGRLAPLMQGYGGIIWATDETQKETPCFVLVPSFKEPATNDQYQVTDEVTTTYALLQQVIAQYQIDTNRLYATGQSMGGMISFYLNVHYPDLFAASLYVGTHWNFEELKGVIGKQKFFYIASENDKAAPVMEKMETFFQKEHIPYAETRFAAKLPTAEKEKHIKELLDKGKNINIVRFIKGSMLPESADANKPGGDHMYSFDYAYQLKAVRQWLLSQHKQ